MKKIIDEYIKINREYFAGDKEKLKEMRPLEEVLEIAYNYNMINLIGSLAAYCQYTNTDSEKIYECLAVMGYLDDLQ